MEVKEVNGCFHALYNGKYHKSFSTKLGAEEWIKVQEAEDALFDGRQNESDNGKEN